MRTPRRLTSVLTVAIALAGRADAAALGEVLAQSALGEPLRVELELAGGSDPRKAAECLRLVPAAAVPDGLPWLAKGRLSTNGSRLVVSNSTRVFDPVLRFALEDVCTSRLRREYTLLLSYPEASSAPALATEAPHSASPPPARRPARRERAPAVTTQTWITAPGESIDSLAHALFPKDANARRRFIAATLKANPKLGVGATAALPPGTELAVPDPSRLPPAPPPRMAKTAPATKLARRTEPERRTPVKSETGAATAQQPAPSTAQEPVADRLLLGAEAGDGDEAGLRLSTELGSVQRTALTSDSERALLRREQQLIMALDRITESQLALSDRIRRLEEIESALTQRAIELGAVAAPPAAEAASDDPALSAEHRAPTASGREWLYAAALFAATALVLALALLRLRQRGPREAYAAASSTFEPATAAAPATALDDSAAAPATTPAADRPVTVAAGEGADDGAAAAATRAEAPASPPSRPPVNWGDGDGFFFQPPAAAPLIVEEEQAEEHDSAIELAEIMVSFGRVQGAAETLAEFIRGNPKQAVTPWLKLLEVYRLAGLRAEFDALARQLNKTFNVKTVNWENFDVARAASESVEDMPHICSMLEKSWGTRECQAYLQKLLRDNRDGTRQGFPLSVIDEILMLSAVLEHELGPYRPEQPPPPSPPPEGATEGERRAA